MHRARRGLTHSSRSALLKWRKNTKSHVFSLRKQFATLTLLNIHCCTHARRVVSSSQSMLAIKTCWFVQRTFTWQFFLVQCSETWMQQLVVPLNEPPVTILRWMTLDVISTVPAGFRRNMQLLAQEFGCDHSARNAEQEHRALATGRLADSCCSTVCCNAVMYLLMERKKEEEEWRYKTSHSHKGCECIGLQCICLACHSGNVRLKQEFYNDIKTMPSDACPCWLVVAMVACCCCVGLLLACWLVVAILACCYVTACCHVGLLLLCWLVVAMLVCCHVGLLSCWLAVAMLACCNSNCYVGLLSYVGLLLNKL